jgi:hypothetical protein
MPVVGACRTLNTGTESSGTLNTGTLLLEQKITPWHVPDYA